MTINILSRSFTGHMRFLSFHVDYFSYKVTKKGRSRIIEELTDENRAGRIENALVLFISMEKQDETNSTVLQKAISEIKSISHSLKVSNLVLAPFAHLFGELSSFEFAFNSLKELEARLKADGYFVSRLPFGWFNELELKAKGHPLSRISRIIS
ncbi:MAG: threonyl-tRNA synthetase editing domain-containing protein [Promethearchaeota archaeon]